MIIAVADTHAVHWYLAADPRLSATAHLIVETALQEGNQIAISAISLIEITDYAK
jgi:PIN domain nuclease of toxin-antitoxin system